jgi:hypothetical protein
MDIVTENDRSFESSANRSEEGCLRIFNTYEVVWTTFEFTDSFTICTNYLHEGIN